MPPISPKLVRLKRQLAVAEARKEFKDNALRERITQGITTAYKSKGDLIDYYVPSISDPAELYIKVSVSQNSLDVMLGGHEQTNLTTIGGFLELPTGKSQVQQRGFSHEYLSIKVVHRRQTAVSRLTSWGTRVIDYSDAVQDQKSRQLPIGGDSMREINTLWRAFITNRANALKPSDIYLLGTDNSTIERQRSD